MTEIKAEYSVKKLAGNGKLQKDFPVKVVDNEQFLKFVVNYIKFPLSKGACQIVIHSDGKGLIVHTEEKKVNK